MGYSRWLGYLGLVGAAGALAACSDSTAPSVPDLNNGSVSGFTSNPTLSGANALVLGMIRQSRDIAMHETQILGEVAREGYDLCGSCNDLNFYLEGPITPNTFYIGNTYNTIYTVVREANIVLTGLPSIPGLSSQETASLTGFIQTIEALDLSEIAFTRDTFGMTIVPNPDPTGTPGPVVTSAVAYQHILNLLDSGYANLEAGGAAFTFSVPSGFGNYSTPNTFALVNRALRARVDIHTSTYTQALTDLAGSFLNESNSLADGVIFQFATTSGDETTVLFQAYLRASPRYVDSAQLQTGGAKDARLAKLDSTASLAFLGVTSPYLFTAQQSAAASLPMIRNEELILMRAEAELGTGDQSDALTDINFIRVNSGGLPPTTLANYPTADSLLTELLYEKAYSLLWEDGHRWIDLKHYGRLADLPQVISGAHVFDIFPFSQADCNAFPSPLPAGCSSINGLLATPSSVQ
jgi:starch-binding outer membrane protein, SusD/RagB family